LSQFPTQLTEQSFVHIPVSVNELGQFVPPLADGVVIVKVLVLLPFAGELLFIQVALQTSQLLQLPIQLTEQSFIHVSVSTLFAAIVQATPPLADGVVIVKVLVLFPLADELLFIQVALHAPQLPQLPIQLTEQSFLHVAVSILFSAIVQATPPLAAGVVTIKVLVLFPLADELLFIQTASQDPQFPQLPIQLTEQSVLIHI